MTNNNGQKKRGKSSKKSEAQKPAALTKCEGYKKRKTKDSSPITECFPQLTKLIKDYLKGLKKKKAR